MEYTDQTGRTITLEKRPKRIVSVVPSQTELLYYLGLEEEIKGITWFCIHPTHHFSKKEKVGGTKKLNFERIAALEPDLIIANKEENEKSQIEELAKHYPVWISDITTLDDALLMIEMLGEITDRNEQAIELCNDVITRFDALKHLPENATPTRAAYLIWRNPWMAAGNDTFINSMLQTCGFSNVLSGYMPQSFDADADSLRYPRIEEEDLKALNPEVVLLSSEPFPFKEKHIEEIRNILPCAEIKLVDGEMFSWYGSRLLHSPAYFEELLKSLQKPSAVHSF